MRNLPRRVILQSDDPITFGVAVNCDQAFYIGEAAASSLTGKFFSDIKLSRSDRVVSIAGSKNAIKVRGQEVVINHTLQIVYRICFIE